MDLLAENRILKEALLGVRGMAVLEATQSAAWSKAVEQIDMTLAEIGLEEAERDLYGERERDDVPSLREEREMRDAFLDDPHRGAVPRDWSR